MLVDPKRYPVHASGLVSIEVTGTDIEYIYSVIKNVSAYVNKLKGKVVSTEDKTHPRKITVEMQKVLSHQYVNCVLVERSYREITSPQM